jgi:hypothetical protein
VPVVLGLNHGFLTQYVHSIDDLTLIGLIVLLFHSYVSIDSKPNWIYFKVNATLPSASKGRKITLNQMSKVLASNKVNLKAHTPVLIDSFWACDECDH